MKPLSEERDGAFRSDEVVIVTTDDTIEGQMVRSRSTSGAEIDDADTLLPGTTAKHTHVTPITDDY